VVSIDRSPLSYSMLCSIFLFCMGISNNQCSIDIFGMGKIMINKVIINFYVE
jgi:hypothetical protein